MCQKISTFTNRSFTVGLYRKVVNNFGSLTRPQFGEFYFLAVKAALKPLHRLQFHTAPSPQMNSVEIYRSRRWRRQQPTVALSVQPRELPEGIS